MLSLSRVPFPLKKTICAYASGLFCQRNKLLTPCTMEPRLFSSNSQSSPNYFLILKIPNKLSTTCFRVFNMISLVNCNCFSEFLNVHIHSSMVKCWLSQYIDQQLRSFCRRITENICILRNIHNMCKRFSMKAVLLKTLMFFLLSCQENIECIKNCAG